MIGRIIFSILFVLLVSCNDKNVHSFYVRRMEDMKEKEIVFKLSLEEEKAMELQKIIKNIDASTKKAIHNMDINVLPIVYTEYELVEKDVSGVIVSSHVFRVDAPFSLEYYRKEDSCSLFKYLPMCSSLYKEIIFDEYYSINRFFSGEEKKKLETLIPSWTETDREKMWDKYWQQWKAPKVK